MANRGREVDVLDAPSRMKAIVQDGYGPPDEVLRLDEVDTPRIAEDEVLVKVRAASVHPDVWHVVTGRPFALRLMGSGLARPKVRVPGTDCAGVAVAVGKAVTRFRSGDEVFGEAIRGMQWRNGGTFAEYAAVPEEGLALKPANVSFEEAAGVPTSGIIALSNLRSGGISGAGAVGRKVLINGAGGGVGSIALQAAKAWGATVTGVDHGEKRDLLLSLGADEALDYAREDFTRSGGKYDLILDVASTLSLADCRRALSPSGLYVLIGHDHFGAKGGGWFGSLPRFFALMARTPFDRHLPKLDTALPDKRAILEELRSLLETGRLTPKVDRVFPLGEAPAALRRLQGGTAKGRILIAPV